MGILNRNRGLGLLAAACLAGASFWLCPGTSAASVLPCPATQYIEVGGNTDPTGQVFLPGDTVALADGASVHHIVYSASIAPWQGQTIPADASIAEGVSKTVSEAHSVRSECPTTHVVIVGFSEGAIVGHKALTELSSDPEFDNANTSGVLYGDAMRAPGVDGVGGVFNLLPNVVPGYFTFGQPDHNFGRIPVNEVANTGDLAGYAPNPLSNPLGFARSAIATLAGAHLQYDFTPALHSGDGNTIVPLYGPPVPDQLPLPTPREILPNAGSAGPVVEHDITATGAVVGAGIAVGAAVQNPTPQTVEGAANSVAAAVAPVEQVVNDTAQIADAPPAIQSDIAAGEQVADASVQAEHDVDNAVNSPSPYSVSQVANDVVQAPAVAASAASKVDVVQSVQQVAQWNPAPAVHNTVDTVNQAVAQAAQSMHVPPPPPIQLPPAPVVPGLPKLW